MGSSSSIASFLVGLIALIILSVHLGNPRFISFFERIFLDLDIIDDLLNLVFKWVWSKFFVIIIINTDGNDFIITGDKVEKIEFLLLQIKQLGFRLEQSSCPSEKFLFSFRSVHGPFLLLDGFHQLVNIKTFSCNLLIKHSRIL